jgi:hypothetical protein
MRLGSLIDTLPGEVQIPIPNHPKFNLLHEIVMKSKIEKNQTRKEEILFEMCTSLVPMFLIQISGDNMILKGFSAS